MSEDMAICRIDYLRYDDMLKINDLVKGVWIFVTNTSEDLVEDYIQKAVGQMAELFEGMIKEFEHTAIVQLLRRFARAVKNNDPQANKKNVDTVTNDIIKIVQGEKKMTANDKLTDKIFKHVSEAMEKAERGAMDGYAPGPSSFDIAHDTAVRIVEDVFGEKVPTESAFVDRYYEMDPETEDVLDNGTLIVDGMKVLVEDPTYRVDIEKHLSTAEVVRARMRNRWATVEGSKVFVDAGEKPLLTFVGVYEDGVKRKWSIPTSYAWIVKTDSIPRLDIRDEEKFEKFEKSPSVHQVQRRAAITDTEVFDEGGLSILSGTVHDLQAWAKSLPKDSKYLDYPLRYAGTDKIVTVKDFLVKPVWDDRDLTDTYDVVKTRGGKSGYSREVIYTGTKKQVFEYLRQMDNKTLVAWYEVFYVENQVDIIPAIDFMNNQTRQGGDYR